MSELKLCKDCKHFRGVRPWRYSTCQHPNQYATSPVTGEIEYEAKFTFCRTQRITIDKSQCGPSGRWFEQTDVALKGIMKRTEGRPYPLYERIWDRLFG